MDQGSEINRNSSALRIVPILILAVVAVLSVFFAVRKLSSDKSRSSRSASIKPVSVRLETLKLGSIRMEITGYGTVEASRKAVVSSPLDAKVLKVSQNFSDGEVLLQNEVAIWLDREESELDLSRIQEEIAQVRLNREKQNLGHEKDMQLRDLQKENLAIIENELSRYKSAAGDDVEAAGRLVELRMKMLQGKEDLLKLERTIALHDKFLQEIESSENSLQVRALKLKREIALSEIRAPFVGRVRNLRTDLGGMVKRGEPLFEISDDTRLEAVVQLPSEDVEKWMELETDSESGWRTLKGEQQAVMEWINGDISETGLCQKIVSTTSAGVLQMIIAVPPGSRLKAGMRVRASCKGRLVKDVFVIPSSMLALGKRIYLARPEESGDYSLDIRHPPWLRVTESCAVAREGLVEGELAVLDPPPRLQAGARLTAAGSTKKK